MDLAYDHIAEQSYADRAATPKPSDNTASGGESADPSSDTQRSNLQTEFQETFKAFSNSPWGAKLGGLWGNVRKQSETYYETARKEAEKRAAEAARASEGLRNTVVEKTKTVIEITEQQLDKVVREEDPPVQQETTPKPESSSSDTTSQENETLINRLKLEAAKRLKDVQKAEDAADEALLRFGTNIRNFLRDAVAVTAPEPGPDGTSSTEVLFESKDATTGRRVIHTTRFDAQLHVVHTTLSSFTEDPSTSGGQWEEYKKNFDIDQKTEDIAKDLETYTELRSAMEKLVPEKVEYADFWTRYYFLRHVLAMQEDKRKEMLKATATTNDEEEVGWDEDSDEDEEKPKESATPQTHEAETLVPQKTSDSTSTMHPPAVDTLRLPEPRRSHDEKSVADSDASYDVVSGAPSRAAGSPKERAVKAEESDEEDWE